MKTLRPGALRAVLVLMALLLCVGSRAQADVMADIVSAWSAAFGALADTNTGLTIFPLLGMPLGGLPEGMAGAYAAFGGGAEGLDTNPAGSPLMKSGELFLSHRNGIGDSSLEGAALAGSGGPFGFGTFAKIFLVPFTSYDASGLPAGSGYYSEAVAGVNGALLLVPFSGGGGLSAGANLKAAVRMVPPSIAQGQSAMALALDAGLLLRVPLGVGPGAASFGAALVLRNAKLNAIPTGYPLPTAISVGLAYTPFSPLTIEADVDLPVDLEGGYIPVQAISGAVGLEVRFSGFAGVHAGFRLRGDNPLLTLGASLGLGAVDLVVNYSLDLMGGVNPLENYSVSATVRLGK